MPLDRVRQLGVGLLAWALPACLPVPVRPDMAAEYDPAPYAQSLPPIPVRRSTAAKPVRKPLPDAVATRRLEPPRPLPQEVLQVRADVPADPPPRPAPAPLPILPAPTPPPSLAEARADSPVVEALRCYQNKAPDQAARHLRPIEPTSRELLACLLPLAVRIGEGGLPQADPQDLAALVDQVQGLLGPLRERAALEIPRLCFCRPVSAPGRSSVYELLDENHLFRPGEMVAVYMELRNFTCLPNGSDFRTHVVTTVEIRDERDQLVERFDITRDDPSLSPRLDFSNGVRFPLPSALPAGAYTLWLKVTDAPTGRTAKRSLDFRVTTVPPRRG
jgi:hypothetical protein